MYDNRDFEELLKFSHSRPRQERVPLPPTPLIPDYFGARRPPQFSAKNSPQRVAVKVSYGPASRLQRHTSYIQREGTGLDGKKAELFTEGGRPIPTHELEGEKHVFSLILSPENGRHLQDMKEYTRDFMKEVSKSGLPGEMLLCGELQWFAAVHCNTSNPHSHIVIRGLDTQGGEVRLSRGFITIEARQIASKLATEELGYRTQKDINVQISRELVSDRFTSIDRTIYSTLQRSGRAIALNELQRERLEHLDRTLNLAQKVNQNTYQMEPHWRETLQYNGRQADVIKTISNDLPPDIRRQWFGPGTKRHLSIYRNAWTVEGKIASVGIADELTDRPYLVIQSKGSLYFYSSSKIDLSQYQVGDEVRLELGKLKMLGRNDEIGLELPGPRAPRTHRETLEEDIAKDLGLKL